MSDEITEEPRTMLELAEKWVDAADVLRDSFGKSEGIQLTNMFAYAVLMDQRLEAARAKLREAKRICRETIAYRQPGYIADEYANDFQRRLDALHTGIPLEDRQRELPADAKRVLYSNMRDLYVSEKCPNTGIPEKKP